MSVSGVHELRLDARLDAARFGSPGVGRDQEDFASILGIADRLVGRGGRDAESVARETARGLVATAFIEPMLREVRESDKAPPPFGPGRGEKQFGALIDAKRAMDLVRSADWPIVERLTRDLTRGGAGEKPIEEPRRTRSWTG